jgi:Glycosyltransferase like family 2
VLTEPEPAAVIVPVLRRPAAAARFMASLRAATPQGLAEVYAVADADDAATVAAWADAGAHVEVVDFAAARPHDHPWVGSGRPGSFAEKANQGYRATSEPWLVLVGDDVAFHPRWLTEAMLIAHARQAGVVGLGDVPGTQGAARLGGGVHACHLLLRRGYVAQVGGGWDGPGVLAHEGYWHWAVDDEIVTAAKLRSSWAFAAAAVVEHRHPAWCPEVAVDATYLLGGQRSSEDLRLFAARYARAAGGGR